MPQLTVLEFMLNQLHGSFGILNRVVSLCTFLDCLPVTSMIVIVNIHFLRDCMFFMSMLHANVPSGIDQSFDLKFQFIYSTFIWNEHVHVHLYGMNMYMYIYME